MATGLRGTAGLGAGLLALAAALPATAQQLPADFVTAVRASHPLGYFRLEGTSGGSETGSAQYRAAGGVSSASPGAPIGLADNRFAAFDGNDGIIDTTLSGGIAKAGSIMAWVNLATLPSDKGRILYVAGESEYGNDLDLQFEQDNSLRFYTASGSNVSFKPDPASLAGQWHMIVATMDTAGGARVLYWDGRQAAANVEHAKPGKHNEFSIGESKVFHGRFFPGGIDEVAVWNRALSAGEVERLYRSSQTVAAAAAPAAAPAGGGDPLGIAGVKVEIADQGGNIPLKPEEKVAVMFLSAIADMERSCALNLQAACQLDQLVAGPQAPNNSRMGHLKYDPRIADPNYEYQFSAIGKTWSVKANPRRPGLGGFYFASQGFSTDAYYNAAGPAGAGGTDRQLTERGVEGGSFVAY